jgi:hypothetical protein
MPVGQQRLFSAYGWDGGYESIPLPTLVVNRAPTAQDYGVLSQQWMDTSVTPSNLYFMSNNSAGLYNWILITASAGSGIFSSLTVTPGPISLTGTTNINTSGAAVTTIGTGGTGAVHIGNATGNTAVTGSLSTTTSLSATTTITAGTDITSTTGNIVASAGSVSAATSVVAGTGITATTGNISAVAGNVQALAGGIIGEAIVATGDLGGTASETTLTNASVAVAGGTGVFSLTSTTGAGTGTNAGYLKLYLGVTPIYVPYFTATT